MHLSLLLLLCATAANASYKLKNYQTSQFLIVNKDTNPPEVFTTTEDVIKKHPSYIWDFELEKSAGGDAYKIKTSEGNWFLSESTGSNILSQHVIIASQLTEERDDSLWYLNLDDKAPINPDYITNKHSKNFLFNHWIGTVSATKAKGTGLTGGSQWLIVPAGKGEGKPAEGDKANDEGAEKPAEKPAAFKK